MIDQSNDPPDFYRHAVFERDGWHCGLCGIPTPKAMDRTDQPNAPELGRITPMKEGGGSGIENLRTVCRTCNQQHP